MRILRRRADKNKLKPVAPQFILTRCASWPPSHWPMAAAHGHGKNEAFHPLNLKIVIPLYRQKRAELHPFPQLPWLHGPGARLSPPPPREWCCGQTTWTPKRAWPHGALRPRPRNEPRQRRLVPATGVSSKSWDKDFEEGGDVLRKVVMVALRPCRCRAQRQSTESFASRAVSHCKVPAPQARPVAARRVPPVCAVTFTPAPV
jgi:hypothetical protein